MQTRLERERNFVLQSMPPNTRYLARAGLQLWFFTKQTEVGIDFEIAIYFDKDEGGYCAQLVNPPIEEAWRNPHIGHIFKDGVICVGGASMRTSPSMDVAYAKSCLWAEGIAIMLRSKQHGHPSEFPFSADNDPDDVT